MPEVLNCEAAKVLPGLSVVVTLLMKGFNEFSSTVHRYSFFKRMVALESISWYTVARPAE